MLRAYLFLMFFIPLTFAFAAIALVCTLFDGTGSAYHLIACAWSSVSLRMGGVSVEVAGRENVPENVPVIYMSNHQSNFDILALYQAIPRKFSWIAKEELFSYPIFGHSMRRAGYIPLDRSDGRKSLRSMVAAAARINQGVSVVIFPEGTRSEDGQLIPFKQGAFLLAEKAKVPIVPVSISGSGAINPAKQLWLKPGTIHIRFAEPISEIAQTGRKRADLMNQVRAAIEANLETYR
ncbi:1-acyl-sn-glycerol-3-phosphate acyltransferase 1, chloroplastic [Geobacter sp. OR-1]|uniref:lysophospholipid acyltransferase family protein n=1 Tax=Geobacter sp. OR-1 TaxID=1266765 RepID=UPI000543D9D7|nr:lysophospholipid acyltransferase family protein [Geobacter sp. OR-1]GAM08679.1 1-acyl-sn-glycerol-3-phosphate acyltransferase 1, chloroplastic [Geobacter sp. OR-1]